MTIRDITERTRLERELQQLQAVTDTSLAHLQLKDLLRELLDRLQTLMGVDDVAILLVEENGQQLLLSAAHGQNESEIGRLRIPVGQGVTGRVAATRAPLVVDDLASVEVVYPVVLALVRSVVGVPMLVEQRLVGVVCVSSAMPRHFDESEVQLLQKAADRMALAIDRARLYQAEQHAREQLAERVAQLEAIMEAVPDSLAVYDTEGHIVRSNAAFDAHTTRFLSWTSPEEPVTGRHQRAGGGYDARGVPLTAADWPHARALRGEVFAGAQAQELALRTPDGELVSYSVTGAPLRDAEGHIIGAVSVSRDITEQKRLQREHDEQAEQLDRIFESIADGVGVYDMEGQLVRLNAQAQRILGLDAAAAEYARLSLAERFRLYNVRDEQDRPLAPEEMPTLRVLRGEVAGADTREVRLRTLDGREVACSMSAAPLHDEEGQPTGVVVVIHDQTEQKRLQQEREETQEEAEQQAAQLAAIFEAMADGVVVFDTAGRLIRENAAHRHLLGLDKALLHDSDLTLSERAAYFPTPVAQGRPLRPDEGPLARALRGEVVSGAKTVDLHARTLDGREVDMSVSAAPLRDREGHVTGAVGIFRDQTERKQVERERAEQAEQLDRIFEGITDGLVVYNAEGDLVRLNAEAHRILGMDAAPAEYAQLPVRDRLNLYEARDEQGQPLAHKEWPIVRVLRYQVNGAVTRQVRLRALDGRETELSIGAAPLRDREGRLAGAVVVLHDQTEYKRLAREREEAHARELAAEEFAVQLDAFLAIAAHDIRTPVTAVYGQVQVARRRAERLNAILLAIQQGDTRATATARQAVEGVVQSLIAAEVSGTRLRRMVAQLFDVAQARSRTLQLRLAPCDLAALVQQTVAAQQAAVSERRLDLEVPEDVVPVTADADRLDQVLTNFLTNVLKYSPANQPVTVRLEILENQAVVSVEDHGPGLPSEEQSRIWEVFHRVPGIEVQSQGGDASGSLGLGLHICKQLIELHPGGSVGVESVVGKGSTFWFRLPLAGTMQSHNG